VLGKAHDGRDHEDSTSGSGANHFQIVFSIAEANADGRDRMQASLDAQGRLTIRWDDAKSDSHGRGDDRHGRDDCGPDGGTVLGASGFVQPSADVYAYDADAVDIDGDTLTYSLVSGPSGASIDPATGLVKWTPPGAGEYRFVIRADDGHGGTAQQDFTVGVTRRERLLDVHGTDCNDQIEVSEDEGGIVRVTVNGATRFYSGLTGIRVLALGGNDQVRLSGLTASTLVEGGAGNDKIDGSAVVVAHLELRGDSGNDDLRGGAAADLLDGGAGNDVLRGDAGGDWIIGGLGKDVLFGDAGNDVLAGGEGDDVLFGGCGDDLLVRGPGCDRLDGGAGHDTIVGAAPAQPASMLDWDWTQAASGPTSGKHCHVDWHGKCGAWGLADSWQRKSGFAEFGDGRKRREG
jgi:hypothetical protein